MECETPEDFLIRPHRGIQRGGPRFPEVADCKDQKEVRGAKRMIVVPQFQICVMILPSEIRILSTRPSHDLMEGSGYTLLCTIQVPVKALYGGILLDGDSLMLLLSATEVLLVDVASLVEQSVPKIMWSTSLGDLSIRCVRFERISAVSRRLGVLVKAGMNDVKLMIYNVPAEPSSTPALALTMSGLPADAVAFDFVSPIAGGASTAVLLACSDRHVFVIPADKPVFAPRSSFVVGLSDEDETSHLQVFDCRHAFLDKFVMSAGIIDVDTHEYFAKVFFLHLSESRIEAADGWSGCISLDRPLYLNSFGVIPAWGVVFLGSHAKCKLEFFMLKDKSFVQMDYKEEEQINWESEAEDVGCSDLLIDTSSTEPLPRYGDEDAPRPPHPFVVVVATDARMLVWCPILLVPKDTSAQPLTLPQAEHRKLSLQCTSPKSLGPVAGAQLSTPSWPSSSSSTHLFGTQPLPAAGSATFSFVGSTVALPSPNPAPVAGGAGLAIPSAPPVPAVGLIALPSASSSSSSIAAVSAGSDAAAPFASLSASVGAKNVTAPPRPLFGHAVDAQPVTGSQVGAAKQLPVSAASAGPFLVAAGDGAALKPGSAFSFTTCAPTAPAGESRGKEAAAPSAQPLLTFGMATVPGTALPLGAPVPSFGVPAHTMAVPAPLPTASPATAATTTTTTATSVAGMPSSVTSTSQTPFRPAPVNSAAADKAAALPTFAALPGTKPAATPLSTTGTGIGGGSGTGGGAGTLPKMAAIAPAAKTESSFSGFMAPAVSGGAGSAVLPAGAPAAGKPGPAKAFAFSDRAAVPAKPAADSSSRPAFREILDELEASREKAKKDVEALMKKAREGGSAALAHLEKALGPEETRTEAIDQLAAAVPDLESDLRQLKEELAVLSSAVSAGLGGGELNVGSLFPSRSAQFASSSAALADSVDLVRRQLRNFENRLDRLYLDASSRSHRTSRPQRWEQSAGAHAGSVLMADAARNYENAVRVMARLSHLEQQTSQLTQMQLDSTMASLSMNESRQRGRTANYGLGNVSLQSSESILLPARLASQRHRQTKTPVIVRSSEALLSVHDRVQKMDRLRRLIGASSQPRGRSQSSESDSATPSRTSQLSAGTGSPLRLVGLSAPSMIRRKVFTITDLLRQFELQRKPEPAAEVGVGTPKSSGKPILLETTLVRALTSKLSPTAAPAAVGGSNSASKQAVPDAKASAVISGGQLLRAASATASAEPQGQLITLAVPPAASAASSPAVRPEVRPPAPFAAGRVSVPAAAVGLEPSVFKASADAGPFASKSDQKMQPFLGGAAQPKQEKPASFDLSAIASSLVPALQKEAFAPAPPVPVSKPMAPSVVGMPVAAEAVVPKEAVPVASALSFPLPSTATAPASALAVGSSAAAPVPTVGASAASAKPSPAVFGFSSAAPAAAPSFSAGVPAAAPGLFKLAGSPVGPPAAPSTVSAAPAMPFPSSLGAGAQMPFGLSLAAQPPAPAFAASTGAAAAASSGFGGFASFGQQQDAQTLSKAASQPPPPAAASIAPAPGAFGSGYGNGAAVAGVTPSFGLSSGFGKGPASTNIFRSNPGGPAPAAPAHAAAPSHTLASGAAAGGGFGGFAGYATGAGGGAFGAALAHHAASSGPPGAGAGSNSFAVPPTGATGLGQPQMPSWGAPAPSFGFGGGVASTFGEPAQRSSNPGTLPFGGGR